MTKITQYPNDTTVIQATDFIDVSEEIAPATFESRKMSGADLLAQLDVNLYRRRGGDCCC